MMEGNIPIENRTIGGITFKSLVLLLTIEASVIGVYFKLQSGIADLQRDKMSDTRYNELRLQTLEASVRTCQTQLDNLRFDVNRNSKQIKAPQ
jgi:hypothetical protein